MQAGTTGAKKLDISENCLKVLEKRYLKKDKEGKIIETPDEMFRRVARHIAQADKLYGAGDQEVKETEDNFYNIMSSFEFMPNSPTLMNAGRDLAQLSACFVLPVEDSMESIFEAVKNTALIHRSGGGTGFSFSRLRPKNSMVRSTGGISSGPISFMKVFNAATQAVKQGGCVVPSTRISTVKGLVKIEGLGPVDAKPNTWHPYNPHPLGIFTDEGIEISNEFYNNGVSKILKLTTRNGYSISTTPEHRLRIIDENGNYIWRCVRHIKDGDWVALQKNTYAGEIQYKFPEFKGIAHFNATRIKLPSSPTKELGEFIGLVIGDGAISINQKGCGRLIISIEDKDVDVIDYLFKISDELFGLNPKKQKKIDDKSSNYFFNSTILVSWLRHIGVEKSSALEAYVPELIFRAGREFVIGFLRGLFTADGTVTKEGYPSLCSISKNLIEGTQQLLLSLGIPSGISEKKNRKNAFGKLPLYQLRIITNAGLIEFARDIGFITKQKNSRLKNGLEKICEFNDVIPNISVILKAIYNGPGRGTGPGRSRRGANRKLYRDIQHYLPEIFASRHLSRLRLKRLVNKYKEIRNNPRISWFFNNNQFYDQIVNIQEDEFLTLDIAVPKNNTYIANGFVSHNTRRGANMGILRVDHPDILEFIKCKEEDKEITNFNISVAVTEDFMDKVIKDKEYDLIDPHTKQAKDRLKAKEVFELIVSMAWKNGEPGIIFIDRMNQFNPTPKLGQYESTNPCGEQVLLPFESCNLGSINLSKVVCCENGKKQVNWGNLKRLVHSGVHFLDNVIDMNKFPLSEIEEMTKKNRKIGLGVMGLADMLIQLEMPYNSDEAVELAEKIMSFISDEAKNKSRELVETKGEFPSFNDSVFSEKGQEKMRNATLTTIAPTGTISIISNASSGIEPLFAISYYRNVMDNDKLIEVNPLFEEIAKREGFYSRKLMEEIAEKGSIKDISEVPEKYKKIFVTSHDIAPIWHIRMQAAFQKHTDNAVSKTVNFHNEATKDDVKEVYMLAYKLGCKGVTIYRDKSREEQVLNISSKDKKGKSSAAVSAIEVIAPRPRPAVTKGTTTKVATGCGNLYITINEDDKGMPFEVFIQMGKAGGCAASQLEATGRLVSLALRSGVENKKIIDQLRGIRCPSPSWEKGGRIFSCADAIARVLELRLGNGKMYHEEEDLEKHSPHTMIEDKLGNVVGVCPDCGAALRHEEGCVVCRSCGYSKC